MGKLIDLEILQSTDALFLDLMSELYQFVLVCKPKSDQTIPFKHMNIYFFWY